MGLLLYCEVEGTEAEVLMMLSEVLLWNFPERTRENHENNSGLLGTSHVETKTEYFQIYITHFIMRNRTQLVKKAFF